MPLRFLLHPSWRPLALACLAGLVAFSLPARAAVTGKSRPAAHDDADAIVPNDDARNADAAADAGLPLVVVIHPVAQDNGGEIVLPGSFQPFERALLYSMVSGYLSRMNVDIGDAVTKGDLLARLDVPEMEAELGRAEADLAASQAELEKERAIARLAELTAARLSSLQADEPLAVMQQDVDVATAEATVAHARVDSAAAEIQVSRARLEHLKSLMAYAVIRAPFDGVVVRRFVDPGALVVAGTDGGKPLLEVVSVKRLRLVLSVPEAAAARVHPGLRARITVDELPGRVFDGSVSRIAGALADDTRTMRAEIDLDAREGRLRPGMYASVRLQLDLQAGAVTLPLSSLHHDRDDSYVWTVSDGVVAKATVEILEDDGQRVTVLAGIDTETVVLLIAPPGMQEGQAVRIKEGGTAR